MKKVNKILLGSVLPFLGLSVAVPVITTSCSVQSATIVESKWNDLTTQQENSGLSLNKEKNELTFDVLMDKTSQEGDPIPTLEDVKSIIFEGNKIAKVVTDGIFEFDKFQSIELEGKEPEENINDKIATFNFLLSRKDGLEISRLKLIIKNYLIDGTWSNKSKSDFINNVFLSNKGLTLNVDLTNIGSANTKETKKWFGLDSTSTASGIKIAIKSDEHDTQSDLTETFKKLIDQEKIKIGENIVDKYNSFKVTSVTNTNSITFTIKLSNNTENSNVKEKDLIIIVKNTSGFPASDLKI